MAVLPILPSNQKHIPCTTSEKAFWHSCSSQWRFPAQRRTKKSMSLPTPTSAPTASTNIGCSTASMKPFRCIWSFRAAILKKPRSFQTNFCTSHVALTSFATIRFTHLFRITFFRGCTTTKKVYSFSTLTSTKVKNGYLLLIGFMSKMTLQRKSPNCLMKWSYPKTVDVSYWETNTYSWILPTTNFTCSTRISDFWKPKILQIQTSPHFIKTFSTMKRLGRT